MSEYEILDLLASIAADQTAVIAQLVSLHLAMVVGIYYFLHRSGLAMKIALFVLYTLGFAMLVGMMANQSQLIVGARQDLFAIAESGARLSSMGNAMMAQTGGVLTSWVSLVANIANLLAVDRDGGISFLLETA